MAALHDTLKRGGYTGHDLERFLVRILFCMFAEDTGIFEPDSFKLYIENRTHPDGSDLGARLNELFAVLDKEERLRQRNLDETLQAFPWVNGALFRERLQFAAFNGPMRKALLEAANFDWSRISPAIFGALFQEVIQADDPEHNLRRKLGAHYTSERDILKVIQPLFLDSLRAEFESIRNDRSTRHTSRLNEFRERLTRLKFLDPACGCGNFLVIAYRELRLLELDLIREIQQGQQALSLEEVSRLSRIDVNQFYGIEIEEWPVRIAEVAMWLMDHQSNMRVHEAFGQRYVRLPLRNSPHILQGNALQMDWNELLPSTECSYILGNPPFVGKSLMSGEQKNDMLRVIREAGGIAGAGVLDYVTAWYIKAARYINGTAIEVAFVSTNSISQGEQPGILWRYLFSKYQLAINFAYQTFAWTSEARGMAHVHVVIVGFSQIVRAVRSLHIPDATERNFVSIPTTNISPYLVEGGNTTILKRTTPLSDVPPIVFGNMANDGGHLLLSPEEREELLTEDPECAVLIRRFIGAEDLMNGEMRYCLWLRGVPPNQITSSKIRDRIAAVQAYRMESRRETTRELAATPALFGEIRQPTSDYLAIPKTSSQTRRYIPIQILEPTVIAATEALCVAGFDLYHLGVLSSSMHMAWVRLVAGRLKSDFRYSNTLVYNNFPWPENPTSAQKVKVEELAQAVLDARALYPDSTLAQLYDPLTMPAELVHAHQRLDRAVERCYRPEPFASDRERVEFLFALYEKLTTPLLPAHTPTRRRRRLSSG